MANCTTPNYLPASFKGFSFEAVTAGSEHGRRGAEGEFPFGEQTAYADLGRRIRTYSIKGRFTGPNHVAEATAFAAICESTGPGVLVHPTRGVVNVACKKAAFSDELIEGAGVTTVDLEFVEANDFLVGFGASILGITVAPLVEAALNSFSLSYQLPSVPFYEKNHVLGVAGQSISAIRSALVGTLSTSADPYGWSSAADLAAASVSLPVRLSASRMSDTYRNGFQAIEANGQTGQALYDAHRSVARYASQGATKTGAAGMAEESIFSTLRLISAGYMARAASYMRSATLDEAMARYDAVVTILEEEEAAARARCDDAMFITIRTFRAEAQRALLRAAYDSPALVSYNFNGGVPSLVAAHQIYGDARRFRDLEARNPLNWPFALGPTVIAATT